MAKKERTSQTVVRNKKASYQYHVIEKLECGIVLKGTEVKSLRAGRVSLDEAYARISEDELWLIGCNISPYEKGGSANHEPARKRKLLVHRRQIGKWAPQVKAKGLTLVPLRIYFSDRGLAKVTVALAHGKTHGDKRQAMKKREHQREISKAMRR